LEDTPQQIKEKTLNPVNQNFQIDLSKVEQANNKRKKISKTQV
jgi:transposase